MRKFFLLFLCIFLAGCATITKGRYQEIKIDSNIAGALVVIDGVEMGYTPYKGKIRRDSKGEIKVSKPGYASGETIMIKDKRVFASFFGNMFLGATTGVPLLAISIAKSKQDWDDKYNNDNNSNNGNSGNNDDISKVFTGITSDGVSSTFVLVFEGALAIGLPAATLASIDGINGAAWEYSPSQYYVQLKEEGQSSLNFCNEIAIRYFSSLNHSQIAIDANTGKNDGGEYMNALSNLMGKTDGEIARQSIYEALEESKGDQVLFGDELITKFRE